MGVLDHAINYRKLKLDIIPAYYNEKRPYGLWNKKSNSELWGKAPRKSNVALRLGTVSDLESDDDKAEIDIQKRLDDLGVHNEPSYKATKGTHHLIKIKNVPNYITYKIWNDGWYEKFQSLPEITWADIHDMISKTRIKREAPLSKDLIDTTYQLPRYIKFKARKWIDEAFEYLKKAPKGKPINHINSKNYNSRNELELAILTRLYTCGYSYDKIKKEFD